MLVTLPSVESDDNFKSSSPSTSPTSSSSSETEEENEDELELEENEQPEEEEVHSEYQKSDIGKSGKYLYKIIFVMYFDLLSFREFALEKKNSASCLLK